ncbi:MAG TPA: type II secretion system protein [Solidesulfovibrio magneticus]|nr:type II secretion system protein [Solidesulfovibrio magneticus]
MRSRLPMLRGRRYLKIAENLSETLGFTIIEVVAVLVLLGIMAIAVVNRTGTQGVQAMAEADALRSALRYAQSRAMGDVYTWGISFTASSYQLVSDNPDTANAVLPGQGTNTRAMPANVALSGANFILFDSRGQPVSGNITTPGGSAAVVTGTQTISVTESSKVESVSVTPYTGFIP